MIKFISIDKALGTGTGKLGYNTLSDYINNTARFKTGTDQDAIIFFKLQKTIWAKGTFYTCTPAMEQVISDYTTSNVSGTVANTDTILEAILKLQVLVNGIPQAMVFKGTIGTDGTETSVPSNPITGDTYKIIGGGNSLTFNGISETIDVGDTVIYSTNKWILIPSGDEPSGTVTSVDLTVPTGLTVSNSPITSSGTLAIAFDDGYSIPTTTQQTAWSNKQNAITDGSATIASVSDNVVTIKAGVSQSSGAIGNSSGIDITLAKVAKTGNYTDLTNKPTIPAAANDGAFQLKVDNTVIGGTSANTSSNTNVTFAAGGAASVSGDNTNNTITYIVTQAVYDTTKANPTYGTFTTNGVITNSTLMAVLDWEELS